MYARVGECVFQKLYTDLKTIVFHFCFSHGFNNSNFNCSLVLAASLQHRAASTRAFGLLPSATVTTIGTPMVVWWPLVPIGIIYFNGSVAWWPLVPIGILYFNGSVAISHHWYKYPPMLVVIGKSPNSDSIIFF